MIIAEEAVLGSISNMSQKIAESEYTEGDKKTFKALTDGANRLPESAAMEDIQSFVAILISFMQKKEQIEFGDYCLGTLLRFLRSDERVFQMFRP